jgi:hypothetical protein
MTLRLDAIGVGGLTLVLGCAGDRASPSVEDPPAPSAQACVIVNDSLVLPSDGGCRLSAQQRAAYRLQGADPACSAGRVEFGGLSGGQVNLNGLQIRCESGAELPDMPGEGSARMMTDELTPSGGPETGAPVTDVDPLAGDVSVDGPPSAPALLEGETGWVLTWQDFDGAPGTRCGVINASDSSFAVVGDGFNRIPDPENVDQAPAPMPEGFSLVFIPFEEVLFEEPSTGGTWHLIGPDAADLGELVFTQDSTDPLRLWLLGRDGTVLDGAFEPSGITPEDLAGAPCDPCTFLAGTRRCVPLP